MKKVLKKITLNSVSEILSDSQLKQITGGSDYYYGTGSGSPCYSGSGSCHSSCVAVVNGHPRSGNCVPKGNMCACDLG